MDVHVLVQAAVNLGAVSAIALFLAKQNESIVNKLVNGHGEKLDSLGDKIENLTLQVERLNHSFYLALQAWGGSQHASATRPPREG